MRRRLDVAAALLHNPPVLFLDEPTTGLDPESRLGLWESIRGLVRSGTTVLLTTQYLEEADVLADEVVVISEGHLVGTGTPGELKARFGSVLFDLGFGTRSDADLATKALTAAGYRPERSGTSIRIRSADGSAAIARVLRSLDGLVPDPTSVAVREPTLDDVFLSLTGGQLS
jgi:ABC-2 type transport system ATP-binding protein